MNELDIQRRIVSARQTIEGFHAAMDAGEIPVFGTFETDFVILANDVHAYVQANPGTRYERDFNEVIKYFRDLGPKLELRREYYRSLLNNGPQHAKGFKKYAG